MIDKDIELVSKLKNIELKGKVNKQYIYAKIPEEYLNATENVLKELNKYRMISDKLAEKLELLIFSIYHKEEILSVNINKVKEYYENNKSIKAALIKECEEELVCFLRERGRRWVT